MQRMLIFDVESLAKLLTHYTDGVLPLDAEIRSIGFSAYIPRWIQFVVESKEWQDDKPLHIRYEGNKIMTMVQTPGSEPDWTPAPEAPERK